MADYLTPGVYVEEVPSSQAPIEGVGTAVAAFIGLAPGGPVNVPQRIASWADFVATYVDPNEDAGPFMEGAYLAHAVYGYYENGGQVCWCVRVGAEPAPEPARAVLGRATANGTELRAMTVSPEIAGPITVTVREERDATSAPEGDGDGSEERRPAEAKPTYTIDVTGPEG